jgi:transcription factor SFP1
MRDFSCCGMILPSLHDLLQHYEEAHAQKNPQPAQNASTQQQMPDARAAMATNVANAVQQQAQQQHGNFKPIAPAQMSARPSQTQQNQSKPSGFSSNLQTIPDMDTVDDMEMDDMDGIDEKTPPPNLYTQSQSTQPSPQTQFSQPNPPRVPQLNMNMMQSHQALRNSTPSTPVNQGRQGLPFQNNPTVSSVNTPTLTANPMQQQFQDLSNQYRGTPDSSAPGTPAELDDGIMSGMGDMSMQNNPLLMGNQNQNFGLGSFGMNNDMLDLCIDEPAKRLFSSTGGYGNQNQQYAHMKLGSGQYGANSDIARRIREQQMLAGVPDTTAGMMPNDEPKPFRCPVIGCEKAYKNQNGLKYHKSVSMNLNIEFWSRLTISQHGHNNQRLHDNADGTFSIVNPETSVPYEGTLGMEKEKPYKCETCGKRYKNLNGLKYHKSHSPPCDPELQLNGGRPASAGMMPNPNQQNLNVGATGAGLSGEAGIL